MYNTKYCEVHYEKDYNVFFVESDSTDKIEFRYIYNLDEIEK